MSNYVLSGDKFEISNYTKVSPFSSFLPGVAGVDGIPIWAFYTNRGQGINSFGINHKGDAIMEFNPANTAYENTPVKGFRTFVKADGQYYEPFCSYADVKRQMSIEMNVLSVVEESHGLKITVSYCILPHENVGGLLRKVTVENISGSTKKVELLDGMAQIIPYGIQNGQYKEMSNLFKSWADIKNIENESPLFAMRASSDDSAEVTEIEGGYFYTAAMDGKRLHIIYDKRVVFAQEDSMVMPAGFMESTFTDIKTAKQCFANKIPCAFAAVEAEIKAGESRSFVALVGFAQSIDLLNEKAQAILDEAYVSKKFDEARALTEELTARVDTKTANPIFDKYVRQSYLDNFLRGGYPYVFKNDDSRSVVHLFSRKHGDPERDYNFFSTAGEYFSQGNGNYRDVCQNRRMDVSLNPEIGDFNIWQFYSYIQVDGYNPLEIRPSTFVIKEKCKEVALKLIATETDDDKGTLEKILSRAFTPGEITNAISKNKIKVKGSEIELAERLIALSDEQFEATFGEGYWSDHWDYNQDLIDDYLSIFPEKEKDLLFGEEKYKFYNSPVTIRPRRDAYVLSKGKVRQYGSLWWHDGKKKEEGFDAGRTNWLKNDDGSYVTTNLYGKLLTLILNKLTLLDNEQLGLEMEGGKPGWNDAMNGLPGLFGSGMPETIELKRTIDFTLAATERHAGLVDTVTLPQEIAALFHEVCKIVEGGSRGFEMWDQLCIVREHHRMATLRRLTGEKEEINIAAILDFLNTATELLSDSIKRALEIGGGIMPTYITYEAVDFEVLKDKDGNDIISPYGLPSVKVKAFKRCDVPKFLEGPARLLAASKASDIERNRKMAACIKDSDIYDKKLGMYKTSESIERMSMENGRVRAFTPGWLERESIFLHMEYKYLLGLFKAGLYKEYYEAINTALVPFISPDVYKRSTLENSSFIASSANPDESVHGQGFVARLSGSTVEVISMWKLMFVGNGGFKNEGGLKFEFKPLLAKNFFDTCNYASFNFCGCRITYVNKSGKNTWEDNVAVTRLTVKGSTEVVISGNTLDSDLATQLREGKLTEIVAEIN